MRYVPVLFVLAAIFALAIGQDPRICYVPNVDGPKLPLIEGKGFAAGYEKKQNTDGTAQYSYLESGVHSFTSQKSDINEALLKLANTGNYKDVVDVSANQVLVLNLASAWSDDSCVVKSVKDYATEQDSLTYLIGLENTYQPMLGPLGLFFLNISATPLGDALPHNDMAVERYSSCYWDESKKLTAFFIWWYLKGTRIPAAAMVKFSVGTGLVKHLQYDFFDFQIVDNMGIEPFELPHFYICADWKHTKPPQNLSKTLSFDSEVLMKYDDPFQPELIRNYQDQMDAIFNVSRRTTESGSRGGNVELTTTIIDGTSNIRYIIDDRIGNCTMSLASKNTDILWTHLLTPGDFWHNTQIQFYAGQKVWRGMICETAVYEVLDPNYRVAVRYELYIAQNSSNLHLPASQLPVAQLVGVPPNFQPRVTTYQHIYNYDVNTATIADYDVSPCYVLEQQRHFVMRFPASSWIVERYSDLLRDSFIRSAAVHTKLSPVRITMVDVESTDYLHVTFTILHQTHVSGALTQMSTTTAINTMYNYVSGGNFKVILRYEEDQQIELTALELEEISRRTPLNWFRGFSSTDMIIIGVTMFLGSLIIALVLFYCVIAPYYIPKTVGGGSEVNFG